MTIYRGPGGTGSATSDADTTLYQDFLNQTIAARDAALQAEVNAELAETNAETAETNAETAATNAANNASSASSSASAAANSASNASSSASAAASSASSASASATNAANSATAAAASATGAANSASTATTQASNASSSATAAASSASSAATSATNAASSASSASTSATNAANSATSASNSASSAATSATNAANSATSASNSATAAAASASEAAGYAASINPADLVHISGTETITGAKTFSQTITGSITGNAGTVTNGVYTTGDQTIAGTKTFSSNPIISSGVANGVCYLNGSKVLTTGSALTFDGTKLSLPTVLAIKGAQNSNLARIAMTRTDASYSINNETDLRFYGQTTDTESPANILHSMNIGGTFVWNNGSGSEQMRLTSTGLGIGTSSPGAKLDVVTTGQALKLSTAANQTHIEFRDTINSKSGYLNYNNDSLIYFRNGPTQVFNFDSSGNLGLGVTPSAWESGQRAFDFGITGTLKSNTATGSVVSLGNNCYYGSGFWRYKQSGQAVALYDLRDTGEHRWYYSPSGTAGSAMSLTQAMTLDASGNLGVGQTPTAYGATVRNVEAYIAGASGFTLVSAASASVKTEITASESSLLGQVGTRTNHPLVLKTNDTERARIDSSGNLLVGTTSGSNRLTVSSTANDYISRMYNTNATGADMLYMQSTADPNNSTYKTIYTLNNASARFYVQSNGGIGNYQANNVNLSDRREKTNFAPAGEYLSKICAIPVQTFNYIDQNMEEDAGLTLGVVAQDVQAVAPELVMESNWGTEENPKMRLSVYQTDLQYALMKALQELKAEFDAYKAAHP